MYNVAMLLGYNMMKKSDIIHYLPFNCMKWLWIYLFVVCESFIFFSFLNFVIFIFNFLVDQILVHLLYICIGDT